jgi:hypothetical protein
MSHSKSPGQARKPLTPVDLSRMQSVVARQHSGGVPKGSHLGRVQRRVARTAAQGGSK